MSGEAEGWSHRAGATPLYTCMLILVIETLNPRTDNIVFIFHSPSYIYGQFYSYRCPPAPYSQPSHLLPTGSEEREVLGVGSIPVAILPSCQDMKTITL